MDWFRMYHDARKDKKLQALTDSEFRVWFGLLCMASEQPEGSRGHVPFRNPAVLALEVSHGDEDLLRQTLHRLKSLEIIQQKKTQIIFLHWNSRQFASDSSTSRVKKYRAKNKKAPNADGDTVVIDLRNGDVTLPERDGNDTVTLLKQHVTHQNRTDTDKDLKEMTTARAREHKFSPNEIQQLAIGWRSAMKAELTPAQLATIEDWHFDLGCGPPIQDVAVYGLALALADENQARRWPYVKTVLTNWRTNGWLTADSVQTHEQSRKEQITHGTHDRSSRKIRALAGSDWSDDSDPYGGLDSPRQP